MMNESWLGFHTLDVERAIDNLTGPAERKTLLMIL